MNRAIRLAAAALSLSLVAAACGDDDDTTTTTTAPEESSTTEAAGPVTITAEDYAFTDIPSEIAAGTQILIQNDSEAEAHEILPFLVPADETRTVDEIMALPQEELLTLLGQPAGAVFALPGGGNELPFPTIVQEPGRYIFACLLPIGGDPQEVLTALTDFIAAGADDPAGPAYPDGLPHASQGMYAEVNVT